MNLNQVTFGNPTKQQKEIFEEDCFVDNLFIKFKENYFPLNDSELVKDELNEIVDYVNNINQEENNFFLRRYKAYDRNLRQAVSTTVNDIKGLICKLKYFYQRPRPNQLAQYYKLKLFPYDSYTANTPSYPSGHTLEAYVILNVIANKYPNEYQFCKDMIDDIAYSRLYLGLHFSSDNDFAKEIAKEILKDPKFTKKYGI
jgi:hypothetical protein